MILRGRHGRFVDRGWMKFTGPDRQAPDRSAASVLVVPFEFGEG
jgi:hypothetical protein